MTADLEALDALERRWTSAATEDARIRFECAIRNAYPALRAEIVELREWVAKQRCQDCASVWGQDCLPTACNCENSRQGDGGPLCPPCRERARKEGK